ncbi:hypothetical protein GCM10023147_36870 [Tsukamurella soli]|uniref:TIGR02680 family protein n=1 Tax=Tsukamurella soli TaxID=644556 RepID=A0ABP8K2F5_9ACTN
MRTDHAAALDAVEGADATHAAATDTLHEDAADAGLPTARAGLELIRDGIADYRQAAAELGSTLGAERAASVRTDDERRQAEAALARHADRITEAESRQQESYGAATRFETLEASVGADVAQLMAALSQVEQDKRSNIERRRAADAERESATLALGEATGERTRLQVEREEAGRDRDATVDALRRFAETGLLTIALPELEVPETTQPWAATPAVQLARTVEAELADVPDDDRAWNLLQRKVTDEHKLLADVLSRQGNNTTLLPRDDGIVVDVMFRGRPSTVAEVAQTLDTEVTERSRLLTEREREILENHLVSEAASSLQELILDAEARVTQMNAELSGRPTSTGMRLRLSWVPSEDAPAGARQAMQQLRRTTDAWNEADRAAVGEFLQQEIERVRTADVGGTWLDHLTQALDYRSWNRFTIQRHQNGQWRPATGPASGGEGALVASVPLFAAAAAHYASAGNPNAPRIVTLDEAFAGVDDDARAKYLGLLTAFDLDVVMTSEREWGCYPEVPGLAIAQLSRVEGVEAVLVTNWQWDGRSLDRVERPAAVLAAPADDGDGPLTEQTGLWG